MKCLACFQEPDRLRWWLPGVERGWELGLHWKDSFFWVDVFLVEGSFHSNYSHTLKDGTRHEEERNQEGDMLQDDHTRLLVREVDMKD